MKKNARALFTIASSKGQVVIPSEIRKRLGMAGGDLFAATCSGEGTILLKRVDNPIVKGDENLMREIESAWMEFGAGKFRKRTKESFLKELKGW